MSRGRNAGSGTTTSQRARSRSRRSSSSVTCSCRRIWAHALSTSRGTGTSPGPHRATGQRADQRSSKETASDGRTSGSTGRSFCWSTLGGLAGLLRPTMKRARLPLGRPGPIRPAGSSGLRPPSSEPGRSNQRRMPRSFYEPARLPATTARKWPRPATGSGGTRACAR